MEKSVVIKKKEKQKRKENELRRNYEELKKQMKELTERLSINKADKESLALEKIKTKSKDNTTKEKESTRKKDETKDINKKKPISKKKKPPPTECAVECEEEDPELVEVLDFIWDSDRLQSGHFVCIYSDSPEKEHAPAKVLLADYPEQGLRFIFDKYYHDKDLVEYMERVARGYLQMEGFDRRKVVPKFKDFDSYAAERKWVRDKSSTGRIKQYPLCFRIEADSHVSRGKQTQDMVESEDEESVVSGEVEIIERRIEVKKVVQMQSKDEELPVSREMSMEEMLGLRNVSGDSIAVAMEETTTIIETRVMGSPRQLANMLPNYCVDNEGEILLEGSNEFELLDEDDVGTDIEDQSIHREVPMLENHDKISTPQRAKKPSFENEVTPKKACELPRRHSWECYELGTYVETGRLSGEKTCIGTRDRQLCGRLFVAHKLNNGKHFSDTEWHPTLKTPAFGCKICHRAMCQPCHANYIGSFGDAKEKRSGKERK